jgi:hypothetical protein
MIKKKKKFSNKIIFCNYYFCPLNTYNEKREGSGSGAGSGSVLVTDGSRCG